MCSIYAYEHISLFESDITIHEDGRISVYETIHVHAQGRTIRHGIVREFPTVYQDRFGNFYKVPFHISKVLLNERAVNYHIQSVVNGKKVFMGDPKALLLPGNYIYELAYKTDRQLGFFETHDELYWNVTGNGWRLPIAKVIARIYLPKNIPQEKISLEAYTGYQGDKDKHYTAAFMNGVIVFKTTQPLKRYQGLTIAVSWPKGFIKEPTWGQKIIWLLKDNVHIIIFCIIFILLVLLLILFYYRVQRNKSTHPIIPLFYPPEGMLPGGVRYFYKLRFDEKVIAADLINMAVQGLITIEYQQGWLGSPVYVLKKIKRDGHDFYQEIMHTLFKKGDEYTLKKSHRDTSLIELIRLVQAYYQRKYENFFDFHWSQFFQTQILGACYFFIAVWVQAPVLFLVLSIVFLELMTVSVFWLLRGYTKEGWQSYNQIEGFKLFLATTETERLKIIGTPPVKTPELYETYLPYAVALGVEKAWSAQFAPLFKKLEQEGHPYRPRWQVGPSIFDVGSFSTQVGSTFGSIISSSSPPGTSSGSRGRGSSGGGGGGGGGGGW